MGKAFSAGRTFPRLVLTGDIVCERYPVIDFAAHVFDLSGQIWACFFFVQRR